EGLVRRSNRRRASAARSRPCLPKRQSSKPGCPGVHRYCGKAQIHARISTDTQPMMAPLRFLLLPFLTTALCGQAPAQASSGKPLAQMSTGARQLVAIKVTGSKRFQDAAVAAASGLQIGTPVNDDDFKRAARNLGETGAFSNIEFTYSYSSTG